MQTLASSLLEWFDSNQRDLPWRHTRDPYAIWISEIMLQQTRTETVKGYWRRFLTLFPDVAALAMADETTVLKAWEGLGYYSRARNLHKAARIIHETMGDRFPESYPEILSLPGIGAYTAGAVGSIAFGLSVPAIDGNVYRVASRVFGIREEITSPSVKARVDQLITFCIPKERPGDFNQALMELGATCCCPGTPDCGNCPVAGFCDAFVEGDAEGLPLHMTKKPPKPVRLSVCLLEKEQGSFYIECRRQSLLKGMYVFYLSEETETEQILSDLRTVGLECSFVQKAGCARHVFTHRIWDMEILHFKVLDSSSSALPGLFTENLDQYPIPAAVQAALTVAKKIQQKYKEV